MSKVRGFDSGEKPELERELERPSRRERSAKHTKPGGYDLPELTRAQRISALRREAAASLDNEDWEDDEDDEFDPWRADEEE